MALEGAISIKMTVYLKWSDKVERLGDDIYAPLCGGIYKEDDGSIVTW